MMHGISSIWLTHCICMYIVDIQQQYSQNQISNLHDFLTPTFVIIGLSLCSTIQRYQKGKHSFNY